MMTTDVDRIREQLHISYFVCLPNVILRPHRLHSA